LYCVDNVVTSEIDLSERISSCDIIVVVFITEQSPTNKSSENTVSLIEQYRAEQYRAEQSRAEQYRAEQYRAVKSSIEQNTAQHYRAE
jgi:hypothetical protein